MAANYQIYRPEWRGWKPGECKSFFAAIEQHRRAAWRVTLVSAFANVAMAVALSVLVAPLFYSVVILLLDLVNLVTPMPNLVDGVYRVVDPILDSPTSPTLVDWLRFVFWATLPGLFWFGCVLLGLRRMLRISGLFDVRAGKRRRRSRLNRATPSICADLSLLRPLLRNERGDALGDLAHGLASDFQILV